MSNSQEVDKLKRIFPKTNTEHFTYVGAGSFAPVYRCKSNKVNQKLILDNITNNNEQFTSSNTADAEKSNATNVSLFETDTSYQTTIIKLIDVYSENVLKSFNGTSARSTVSTYKDAYNEFKVSLYLSYLNTGLDVDQKYYKCCTFPDVHEIYVVDDPVPKYFDNSSKIKQIDYGKLFPKYEDEEESSVSIQCRSRPSITDLATTTPEIAIIKMEDCGVPIGDIISKLRPLQILSLAKQMLLGFMIAEKVFEFEHRDLHMGNIMVKEEKENILSYLYCDKIIYLPSHNVQTKVIDTTFSRLKYSKLS